MQGPFEPFKCPECERRFASEEAARGHLGSAHPDAAAAFPAIEAAYWTHEGQFAAVKEAAFPQLGSAALTPPDADSCDSFPDGPSPAKQPRHSAPGEGKLMCR